MTCELQCAHRVQECSWERSGCVATQWCHMHLNWDGALPCTCTSHPSIQRYATPLPHTPHSPPLGGFLPNSPALHCPPTSCPPSSWPALCLLLTHSPAPPPPCTSPHTTPFKGTQPPCHPPQPPNPHPHTLPHSHIVHTTTTPHVPSHPLYKAFAPSPPPPAHPHTLCPTHT